MKVLSLVSEAVPYVKVGGLGDVAGALPAALRRQGVEVRQVMPRFGMLDPVTLGLRLVRDNFPVVMDWRREECQLWENPVTGDWFIENQYFFGSRHQVYGNGDEIEQFVLFCRAALEACRLEGWIPDVVHGHDWPAAAAIRLQWAAPGRPGLVYTIHNLAHQGGQRPNGWPLLGVYDGRGSMNLMQQAVFCADVVTTVSPTYAREIQSPEFGFGLDGQLRERGERLVGILNGLDLDAWNPATDRALAANFEARDLSGKAACKAALQREMGLPVADVPLVGVVSRLDFQKGVGLLVESLETLVQTTDAQLVVLGSGYEDMEEALRRGSAAHPTRIAAWMGFSGALSRQIYAGSDLFLMPSLFEPCGLSQMIAMRYGSLPVARATGGLVDTIVDRSEPDGFGYLFGPYLGEALVGALLRALADYRDRESWMAAVRRAMVRDFSWDRSASGYLAVYQQALASAGRAVG